MGLEIVLICLDIDILPAICVLPRSCPRRRAPHIKSHRFTGSRQQLICLGELLKAAYVEAAPEWT